MCVILGSIHSCNEGTAKMKMRSDIILNEGYSGLQEKYSNHPMLIRRLLDDA